MGVGFGTEKSGPQFSLEWHGNKKKRKEKKKKSRDHPRQQISFIHSLIHSTNFHGASALGQKVF